MKINLHKQKLGESKDIFEIETKREFGNEKGKLVIQPLGIIVIEFLIKKFDILFANLTV